MQYSLGEPTQTLHTCMLTSVKRIKIMSDRVSSASSAFSESDRPVTSSDHSILVTVNGQTTTTASARYKLRLATAKLYCTANNVVYFV